MAVSAFDLKRSQTINGSDSPTSAAHAGKMPPHINVKTAQPAMRTIAMPADTNPNGDIFGGWILAQMDLAGGSHAFREAQGRVATVAVTGMHFHKPVNVGDEVSCYCVTECVGNTSVAVHVEAWVRRGRQDGSDEMVTEGLFTFVALDENAKPRPVKTNNGEQA